VGDVVGTGQLRHLQPASVEQQTPTVMLPVLPGHEFVISRPPATIADLGTAPAILERMPSGWWCCTRCGEIGGREHLRADHRLVPGQRRWWHRLLRIQPGWTRCQQQ
jgi:hypothetical protein